MFGLALALVAVVHHRVPVDLAHFAFDTRVLRGSPGFRLTGLRGNRCGFSLPEIINLVFFFDQLNINFKSRTRPKNNLNDSRFGKIVSPG